MQRFFKKISRSRTGALLADQKETSSPVPDSPVAQEPLLKKIAAIEELIAILTSLSDLNLERKKPGFCKKKDIDEIFAALKAKLNESEYVFLRELNKRINDKETAKKAAKKAAIPTRSASLELISKLDRNGLIDLFDSSVKRVIRACKSRHEFCSGVQTATRLASYKKLAM